jgi:hypothetical protein
MEDQKDKADRKDKGQHKNIAEYTNMKIFKLEKSA